MIETPPLTRNSLLTNPIEQFADWFEAAMSSDIENAHAMTLATATKDGRPSARLVLLKGYGAEGFQFFSNYASQKGRELAENRQAALVFYWVKFHRQIRVFGRVSRLKTAESEAYFSSRPRGSQLSALASEQSRVIGSRGIIERRVAELDEAYAGTAVPRPAQWGGYQLEPEEFEFWQGRADRLHDRFRYRLVDEEWVIERLSP